MKPYQITLIALLFPLMAIGQDCGLSFSRLLVDPPGIYADPPFSESTVVDGDGVPGDHDEFFEVCGDPGTDLRGWKIYNKYGFVHEIRVRYPREPRTTLPSDGCLIFVTNYVPVSEEERPYNVIDMERGSTFLSDDGDAIVLYDPDNNVYCGFKYRRSDLPAIDPSVTTQYLPADATGSFTDYGAFSGGCINYPGGGEDCNADPLPLDPLPVELIYFTATLDDQGQTHLKWATASETNNDFFTVETSTDGKIFNEISQIPGAGNSVEEITYNYIHSDPVEGPNYYRIKQTDFDGTFTYSDVVVVTVGKKNSISLHPNAVEQMLPLYLEEGYTSDVEFQVFSVLGTKVLEGIVPANARNQTIQVGHLEKGQYFLRLDAPNDRTVLRFVKI